VSTEAPEAAATTGEREPSSTPVDVPAPPARRGDDLIGAAASNAGMTAGEEDALLAYFLGDAPAPNAGAQKTYTVDVGEGRQWTCTLRSIDWAEWQDAQKRALNTATGTLDLYEQASYVVARGMVRPLLGRMLENIREQTGANGGDLSAVPSDGAAMLRRFFAKQAGALIYLQRKVLELSRLDEAGEGGVKEVEAAKN
jgi:hypothetical protein